MIFRKPVRPNWKRVLLGALLLAAAVLIMDVGCVFRKTTGVPCPGCGMTRAHLAALRLDFKDAFFYHPLWFLPAPLAAAELFFPGGVFRSKKAQNALTAVLLAAVLGVYLVRMILYFPDTPPMEYQPDNLLLRLASLLGFATGG